jgi:hypothetical protein
MVKAPVVTIKRWAPIYIRLIKVYLIVCTFLVYVKLFNDINFASKYETIHMIFLFKIETILQATVNCLL